MQSGMDLLPTLVLFLALPRRLLTQVIDIDVSVVYKYWLSARIRENRSSTRLDYYCDACVTRRVT